MQQSGVILLSYIIQVAAGRSGIKLFQMFIDMSFLDVAPNLNI